MIRSADQPDGLECDHCGGTAIEFHPPRHPGGRWLLGEDEGEKCAECGWPGSVGLEGDYEDGAVAYWRTNDWDDGLKCTRASCEECRPAGIELAARARVGL